ncbi:hypothetical protein OG689_23640 [Kitasatospora sp. NBC_00240]|uniref:hypothetical protein n=1 Tax=Kitasatospora sp. NBC_00240 TaxID=2903567 RepID=UPI00225C27FC|nr:hypothetical protein [Kitasatospora sp. NBC_00240]MCX5212239.1 hypothetical protein [Kitasatospora sp. NBC_00240]
MKSMLGKAVLTAVGALAIAGVSAPAHAHVGVAGGGEFAASADPVFAAGEQWGVAHTSNILTGAHQWGWATSTDLAGGQEGFAHIG